MLSDLKRSWGFENGIYIRTFDTRPEVLRIYTHYTKMKQQKLNVSDILNTRVWTLFLFCLLLAICFFIHRSFKCRFGLHKYYRKRISSGFPFTQIISYIFRFNIELNQIRFIFKNNPAIRNELKFSKRKT